MLHHVHVAWLGLTGFLHWGMFDPSDLSDTSGLRLLCVRRS
ncbi:hypothetical protein CEV31_0678 [Brucella thiophenivorans]|uniref:Uncharacterized protein n=1 Tax=Brucella thiophenivorans TaxID=571255 RepID=A0A256G206_9HYPH|nr:hypothetical protein CEV31_0678 [Brucella thiophenivorans]